MLKPQQARSGRYSKVSLGRSLQVQVHQLVCEAWHGPKPAGRPMSVDHVDFEPRRNVATNLRWLSLSQNSASHRSDWAARAAALLEPPEDFTPITADEEIELSRRLAQNGWMT